MPRSPRRTAARAGSVAAALLLGAVATFALTAVLGWATATPASAAAPAGDTESFVTSIDPASSAFTIRVVGGDETMRIDVAPGHEVVVSGYAGEPYLRIDPQGDVWENQRSPAVTANADRYDTGVAPPSADPTATPEWERVGTAGTFDWHDHRMHWMAESIPVPGSPGDLVFGWTIGLTVDGAPVAVAGELRRGPATSPWPWVVLTVLVAAAAFLIGRRRRVATVLTAAVVVTALAIALTVGERVALGCWTCGRLVELVPTIVATVAVVVAAVGRRDTIRVGAAAVALVALTGWLLVQAKVLWNPVLVSSYADPVVRGATAVALGLTGAGLVLAAAYGRRALDEYASLPPAQRRARTRASGPGRPEPTPS